MSHFQIAEWSDFLRGTAVDADRRAMQKHLSTGCPQCQRLVELLRRVARLLHADLEAEPPTYLTRSVHAISRLEGVEARLAASRPQRPGCLSACRPLPAAPEVDTGTKRQVLYFTDEFVVDIVIEIHPESSRASVAGQILRRNGPTKPLARMPAFLICNEEIIAGSLTNSLGEFQLHSHVVAPLHLCLAVDEWQCIALTVDSPAQLPA